MWGVFSVIASLVRCVNRYEVGLESFDAITPAEAVVDVVVGEGEDEEDVEGEEEVVLCVKINLYLNKEKLKNKLCLLYVLICNFDSKGLFDNI